MVYQSLNSSQCKSSESAQPVDILPTGGHTKDCAVKMPQGRLRVRTLDASPVFAAGLLHVLRQVLRSPWASSTSYNIRAVEITISKDTSKAHSYLRRDLSSRCCRLVRIPSPERPVSEKTEEGERRQKGMSDRRELALLLTCRLQKSIQVSLRDLQGERQREPKLKKGSTLARRFFPEKVSANLLWFTLSLLGGCKCWIWAKRPEFF